MPEPTEITARELWDRLHSAAARRFYVLDVRNEDDAARWRVEGALPVPVVNVPYFAFLDDADRALGRVPRDLGEAVCICAKGDSSSFVREVLAEAGVAAVNVAGGMLAWGDLHVPLRLTPQGGNGSGAELWQVSRYGKGCLSYAVVSGGEMAVVDPSRFVDVYERLSRARGARIVEVLETHVHADHVSGGAELARRSGARYRVRSGFGPEPAFEGVPALPLDDGESIRIGSASLEARALRTPGHTPGSTCYVVADRWLLSGDTLFVDGVGRPDLGGHVDEWGRDLHRSLREVVGALPGEMVVLPAHFACRRSTEPDGVVRATLAAVKARAPELAIADRDDFVARMRAGVREPPPAYAEIARANLGLADPADRAGEWELGKNECAAGAGAS